MPVVREFAEQAGRRQLDQPLGAAPAHPVAHLIGSDAGRVGFRRDFAGEAAVGRPVESLRSLTRGEALRALEQLTSTSAPQARSTSSWDSRDEDTWIDRL